MIVGVVVIFDAPLELTFPACPGCRAGGDARDEEYLESAVGRVLKICAVWSGRVRLRSWRMFAAVGMSSR
jgi:hypothetical protein